MMPDMMREIGVPSVASDEAPRESAKASEASQTVAPPEGEI